jgi:hypothetical protein
MTKSSKKSGRASAIAVEVLKEISREKTRTAVAGKDSTGSKAAHSIQDIVFVLSMLSCLILTGLNVTGRMPFQTTVAGESEPRVAAMAYQTVNFAVREIDAYRRQRGRLPQTLTEVGAPADPRWSYEVLGGDRYVVRFEANGFPLAYDSSDDPEKFFSSVRRHR